jgi:hypothetical protein
MDREAQDVRDWRDERQVGLSGLAGLFGLSGAMNKRDETDKANWIDTQAWQDTLADFAERNRLERLGKRVRRHRLTKEIALGLIAALFEQ